MATSTERPTVPEDKLAYVAFVGLRPAAIAVAVLTLGDRVQQVRLIVTTKEARPIYKRLCAFLKKKRPSLDVQQLWCPEVLRVHESLAQWMGGLRNIRVAFHVDPGLGFGVAKLVRHLPSNALLVSTPESQLIEVEVGSSRRESSLLVDPSRFGFTDLRELYGVTGGWCETATTDRWGVLPSHMMSNLEFPVPASQSLSFARACVKAGRLYGLYVPGNTESGEDVRRMESRRVAPSLDNLDPQVTVCSDSPAALAEALSAGLFTISPADAARWPEAVAVSTARAVPELRANPVDGRGGNGPALAVWLGRDPSATLSALFTHKPKLALVLVDKDTKEVMEVAYRLCTRALDLPVSKVQFFKTGFHGDLPSRVTDAIVPPAIFNVSPGTRLQVCSVVGKTKVDLWSLDQQLGKSRCLTTSQSLPLSPVPLLLQIQVACGVTDGGDGDDSTKIPNPEFLLELGRFFADAQERLDGGGRLDLHDLCDRQLAAKLPTMKVTQESPTELNVCIPAGCGQVRMKNTNTGQWLEDLTAVCLIASAKQHNVEDDVELRVGVTLKHSADAHERLEKIGEQIGARTDADVMMRLARDFFLFDAKAGDITVAKQRAGAVARALMVGRFCIPVAVRPFLTPEHKNEYKLPQSGAAAIDLAGLLDTRELIPRLQKMIEKRRRALPEDA